MLFFTSVNKVALVAFAVVFGFLIYELYLFKKEKKKGEKPSVPQFTPSQTASTSATKQVTTPPQAAPVFKKTANDQPRLLFLIGALTVFIVLSVFVYFFVTQSNQKKTKSQSVPIVQEISSAGLKVFNTDWIEKKGVEGAQVQTRPGDVVYIGIQTIEEADIDRARIKVNKADWELTDIVTAFNSQHKVYYKEYTVATGTAQLQIDAQLHSASDGWLGD